MDAYVYRCMYTFDVCMRTRFRERMRMCIYVRLHWMCVFFCIFANEYVWDLAYLGVYTITYVYLHNAYV